MSQIVLVLTLAVALSSLPGALTAQTPADTAQVPATTTNILTELKQSESSEDQIVYVENRSSQTIIVTSLKLSECDNVKLGCHIIKLNARVRAGEKRMVYRIAPANPDQPTSFRYSFTWQQEIPK